MKNTHKLIIALILPGSIASLFLFVPAVRSWFMLVIALLTSLDVEMLQAYIRSLGVWGPLISFALMMLQSVIAPLPAFMLAFANAAVFGWVWGALLSWTSSLAGSALCFGIARLYGRNAVHRFVPPTVLSSVDGFFIKYGNYAVVITRLLPFISFDVVSYAAGLTAMKFFSFLVATAIGELPATLVYSYVGGSLAGGTKAIVTGLSLLFAASVLVLLLKRIFAKKDVD